LASSGSVWEVGFALLTAPAPACGASGVSYGGVPSDAMAVLADACPIVASCAAGDRWLASAPRSWSRS
jgi:hypothetical protein